jgi:hypothetical protein
LDKGDTIIVFLWKGQLGRHRRICENNIKMDYQEVGKGVVLIDLA